LKQSQLSIRFYQCLGKIEFRNHVTDLFVGINQEREAVEQVGGANESFDYELQLQIGMPERRASGGCRTG